MQDLALHFDSLRSSFACGDAELAKKGRNGAVSGRVEETAESRRQVRSSTPPATHRFGRWQGTAARRSRSIDSAVRPNRLGMDTPLRRSVGRKFDQKEAEALRLPTA